MAQRDEKLNFTYRCSMAQRDEKLNFTYRCSMAQRDEKLNFLPLLPAVAQRDEMAVQWHSGMKSWTLLTAVQWHSGMKMKSSIATELTAVQ